MTPEIAVSLATFLIVFVVLSRLGSARRAEPAPDPEVQQARQLIQRKVDEHVEALAQRYLETREQDAGDVQSANRFARDIEAFIGDALLHDIEFEHPGLGPAVREVVTLEREHVYALVLSRIEAHLGEGGLA
jgi:hypothetical protein